MIHTHTHTHTLCLPLIQSIKIEKCPIEEKKRLKIFLKVIYNKLTHKASHLKSADPQGPLSGSQASAAFPQ